METKKNKGGRPEKSDDEKRDRVVKLRFSMTEFNQLLQRRSRTQTKDLSSFIRSVCLDKPIRLKLQTSTHEEQIISIMREMRADLLRIGVNINQSAKRINSTTDYHDLQREVNALVGNIGRVESDLTTILEHVSQAGPPIHPVNGSPN
jgi:hypothetical protein